MRPGKHNLVVYQGATFRKTIYYKPGGVAADLTGFTARCQFRETIDAATEILELTTENGGITLTALEGKIELLITATATAALTFTTAVYDLELIDGTEVIRLIEGRVTLSKEVTRD